MLKIVPRKILVVKNRNMGDSIMGLGTVKYIRSLFPDATIIYAVPAWIYPLYANVKTDADQIWPMDFKSASDWWGNWRKMSSNNIDLVYEMFQTGRTSKFFKIYSTLKSCLYHFHNHHKKKGVVYRQGDVYRPTIQRDLDGAWSLLTKEKSKEQEPPSYLDFEPKIIPYRREKSNLIVLGVVATREAKIWDIDHYINLTSMIRRKYPKYQIVIPLSFSTIDKKINETLRKKRLTEGVFITHKNLADLPEYLSRAVLYIGNDTGMKHLAIAVGTRTITFFGPEPPTEWHPYNVKEHPYFYKENLECRTGISHFCGLSSCTHMSCLSTFTPTDVMEKIREHSML